MQCVGQSDGPLSLRFANCTHLHAHPHRMSERKRFRRQEMWYCWLIFFIILSAVVASDVVVVVAVAVIVIAEFSK